MIPPEQEQRKYYKCPRHSCPWWLCACFQLLWHFVSTLTNFPCGRRKKCPWQNIRSTHPPESEVVTYVSVRFKSILDLSFSSDARKTNAGHSVNPSASAEMRQRDLCFWFQQSRNDFCYYQVAAKGKTAYGIIKMFYWETCKQTLFKLWQFMWSIDN